MGWPVRVTGGWEGCLEEPTLAGSWQDELRVKVWLGGGREV